MRSAVLYLGLEVIKEQELVFLVCWRHLAPKGLAFRNDGFGISDLLFEKLLRFRIVCERFGF